MTNPRYGIANMTLPPEGPQTIRYSVDFASDALPKELDLSDNVPDYMSFVQGVYVDNYACPVPLQILVKDGTQQRVIVPANCQAYIPLLTDNPPKFVFSGVGGNPGIVIPVYFYNMPIPALIIK